MSVDPLIGKQLANFKIERPLGRGGMAQVYFGRDVNLQRPVAIKIIDARYRKDASYAQRFISEAQMIATWRHENIIQVFYADKQRDLYYFVMEYIDGRDLAGLLRDYADQGTLIPHSDVIRIGNAVASALDYAHKKGVIHRDIKPSNVLISSDERIVLTDFGLALQVEQGSIGEVFGSPHYIAPEQARRSADAVPQSDLYSFGVMLFEMLTGVVPFDDSSITGLALAHLSTPPPSPRSINPALNDATARVLLKALSKEPEDRYPTGKALMEALESALTNKTQKRAAAAELPPLPAGMVPTNRRESERTVSEHVAAQVKATKTQNMPVQPRIPPTRKHQKAKSGVEVVTPRETAIATPQKSGGRRGCIVFILVLLLAALTFGIVSSGILNDSGLVAFLSVGSTAELESAQADASTDEPTEDALIQLMWDEHSFYWYNPNRLSIRVSQLAFEAINGSGEAVGYDFDGQRWADVGFRSVEHNKCVSIEIPAAESSLSPTICSDYNSQVNTVAASETIFWVARDGVTQFRVLWNHEEITRCDINAGECEFTVHGSQ
jgi:serine/threonine protein kinase